MSSIPDSAITITAFEHSPDGGEGHARDMRVRWALEEVERPYSVRLLSFEALKTPEHRTIHPFGKIPSYQQGSLTLFESGAIVLHIASRFPGLMPYGEEGRARAVMWLIAALNTVEPPIIEREAFLLLERDKPWFDKRLAMLDDNVRLRLKELSDWLGPKEWLEVEFTAGDLMMVMVLRRLRDAGQHLLDVHPNIADYVAHGERRPAYLRAFQDQRALYIGDKADSS